MLHLISDCHKHLAEQLNDKEHLVKAIEIMENLVTANKDLRLDLAKLYHLMDLIFEKQKMPY